MSTTRRVDAPELVRLIDDVDRQFDPAVILFESNGAFEALHRLLVPTMRFGPKFKAVTQTRDKLSRIYTFSVPVENGSFRLKSVPAFSKGG